MVLMFQLYTCICQQLHILSYFLNNLNTRFFRIKPFTVFMTTQKGKNRKHFTKQIKEKNVNPFEEDIKCNLYAIKLAIW